MDACGDAPQAVVFVVALDLLLFTLLFELDYRYNLRYSTSGESVLC